MRLTAPTILGRTQSEKSERQLPAGEEHGALPCSVLLAVAGSRGHKLACRFPPAHEIEAGKGGLPHVDEGEAPVHGYPSSVLADLLIPKPTLRGQPFDLTIGSNRFIGFPVSMVIDDRSGSRAINVVFVLPPGPALGHEQSYRRILSSCHRATQQLADALWLEESRCGFISRLVSGLFEETGETSGGAGTGEGGSALPPRGSADGVLSTPTPCAAKGPPTTSDSTTLLQILREALLALQEERQLTLRVGERTAAIIGAPSPPTPVSPALAAVEGGMPPPPPLRPYMGMLPLSEREEILRDLPADASPLLRRLVQAANPLRSFEQLHAETGIPMPMIFRLALHLRHWNKMQIIYPLTPESVLCIQPGAKLGFSSEASCACLDSLHMQRSTNQSDGSSYHSDTSPRRL